MGSPPSTVQPYDPPMDYYASPAMAESGCGYAFYEHQETGKVFAAVERTEPGQPPICKQPDCFLLCSAKVARLVKPTSKEFLSMGLPSKVFERRARGGILTAPAMKAVG